MKRVKYQEELEKEKEKLERLVGEALKNGTPIIQDEAIMTQNRKVDVLVVKIQREKERQKEER
ncbi:hypothetical protein [Alkaliphilus peptidifermentans]|uniref:Spo0E like sporulation regulatory protein n=1 Tax=Alkaliphilus peptidifermentans DSM 18978 TaxID=1120976 RepID=A0A1G5IWH5_9FIRM|nr:hypothetical protein [Alkaliphilus peptidifermentans]SCY80423.1 hypothetical protein SAMN03080606_02563 [Alkaliphilus peptidifermentans DSM 18978]